MVNKFLVIIISLFIFFSAIPQVNAQENQIPPKTQEKGVVIAEKSKELNDKGEIQNVTYSVKLDNGKIVAALYQLQTLQKLNIQVGSQVVLLQTPSQGSLSYQIVDLYRLPALFYFLIIFATIAVIIVGKKGIGSLIGVCISLLIILYGIVPGIMHGFSPLLVTILSAFAILLITTFLAHGISKKTAVAVIATGLSLLITLFIASISIEWLSLSGTGSENASDLFLATNRIINAKGLLLSGIIIGTLGALNDVTVTQASTIFEMKKIDHTLSLMSLFKRGMVIGRDHGASMVNTLVLAYAGSSLFLFIFFIVNPQKLPLWAILNSEFLVEEIVVALGGTLGILMSVPIVTLLAAWVVGKTQNN